MDIQVDKEGRIVVGSEDGCVGACVQGGANSFTSKGLIVRQSGGKRLLAQFDPVEPAIAGAPLVTALMDSTKTTVQLPWPVPDNSGSDITGYKVYRRIGDVGNFVLLGTTTDTNFTDTSFDKTLKNYYHVTALNGIGEGPFCHDVLPVLLPPAENVCLSPGLTLLTDAAGDTSAAAGFVNSPAPPGADLLALHLTQPFAADGVVKLVFQIQTDIRRFAHVTASTTRHDAPRTEWTVRMNPRVVECKRRVRDSGQRGASDCENQSSGRSWQRGASSSF